MGLALKCVNKSTVYLPTHSDFRVFGGSVSIRIKKRRAATWNFSHSDNIQWKLRQKTPKIHGGGSSSTRIQTASCTSSSCSINTFVTNELFRFGAAYINKNHDTLTRLSVSNHYRLLAWMHGANTIVHPRVKTRPEGHSWESNKKNT